MGDETKRYPVERVCEMLVVSDREKDREVLIGFMDADTRQALDLFVVYDESRRSPDQYSVDSLLRLLEDNLPILTEKATQIKGHPVQRIMYPLQRKDDRERNVMLPLPQVEVLVARLRGIKAKMTVAETAPANAAVETT